MHVRCGVHVVAAGTEVAPLPEEPVDPSPGEEADAHLLALSWQPAFCEYRPEKAECRALNAGDLPVTETRLSLHGLWPQPEGNLYCGVPAGLVALDEASRWADLPEVPLDEETREALAVAMPGTASFLERHEWIKHGTCHRGAGEADEYYDDSLRLVDAVNAAVAELFAAGVGGEVGVDEVRQAFDAAFGPGAGDARADALRRRRRPDAGAGAQDRHRRGGRAGRRRRGAAARRPSRCLPAAPSG